MNVTIAVNTVAHWDRLGRRSARVMEPRKTGSVLDAPQEGTTTQALLNVNHVHCPHITTWLEDPRAARVRKE